MVRNGLDFTIRRSAFINTILLLLFGNPLGATLYNLSFYPLGVVSRYRDPQLQVGKIAYFCRI